MKQAMCRRHSSPSLGMDVPYGSKCLTACILPAVRTPFLTMWYTCINHCAKT
jgi:hypothetical protein